MECGSEASAHAEANASALQTGQRAAPLSHAVGEGLLKGVGFFSRGRHGGRDARVPSVARAGSASVSLAWRQKCPARQRREQARPPKTYPFKERGWG
jgi:hypothetical protein